MGPTAWVKMKVRKLIINRAPIDYNVKTNLSWYRVGRWYLSLLYNSDFPFTAAILFAVYCLVSTIQPAPFPH